MQIPFRKSLFVLVGLLLTSQCVPAQLLDLSVLQVQPQSQMLELGSGVTFSVNPVAGGSYQWLLNGNPIPSQTNSTLTIQDAQIGDAGYYSCNISTRLNLTGSLAVGSALNTTPTTSVALQIFAFDANLDIVIYNTPVMSSGSQGSCPGAYKGYVCYQKTTAQGWGWGPSTNTTLYVATDNNRTNTKVQYLGDYGDSGCATNSVTVPYVPFSDAYRFVIYFTNNVPTTNYPITLTGFNP